MNTKHNKTMGKNLRCSTLGLENTRQSVAATVTFSSDPLLQN